MLDPFYGQERYFDNLQLYLAQNPEEARKIEEHFEKHKKEKQEKIAELKAQPQTWSVIWQRIMLFFS